jgi:hypothetical protein
LGNEHKNLLIYERLQKKEIICFVIIYLQVFLFSFIFIAGKKEFFEFVDFSLGFLLEILIEEKLEILPE